MQLRFWPRILRHVGGVHRMVSSGFVISVFLLVGGLVDNCDR